MMKRFQSLLVAVVVCPVIAFAQNAAPRPTPVVSPEIRADGSVTFRLRAGQAKEVALRAQWAKQSSPLSRADDGVWSVAVDAVPAGVWEYSFLVDGLNVLDPANPTFKPQREPGRNILHIAATPPNPWDWQDVPHGTVHQHAYHSKALDRLRELWVYTPPGYERSLGANPAAPRCPLLVLQHGSGDSHQTWVVHGKAHWILDNLIAAKLAKPMIVVMLDGHPLGMMTRDAAPQRRGAAIDAFRRELFEDALPLVESLYHVEPDAAQRAIAGLSMGGGQSLSIGLGNLDRFAWVGAFSAAVPANESPLAVLSDPTTKAKLKLLWIGCGKDDFLRARNEEFIAALTGQGVPHEWQLTDGDHSWPVWRRYLAEFAPKLFQISMTSEPKKSTGRATGEK